MHHPPLIDGNKFGHGPRTRAHDPLAHLKAGDLCAYGVHHTRPLVAHDSA
jgi:hypothetical protein